VHGTGPRTWRRGRAAVKRSAASPVRAQPPLIAHVIVRLGIGGLENGLVNLINSLPAHRFRHAVISLTDASAFQARIRRSDVNVYCLGKRPGHDWTLYWKLWRLFRDIRPAILHTRNLGALDATVPARAAGIRRHVHGVHGWDVSDLHGTSRKYRLLRRALDPAIDVYVALSRDLERWLCCSVGIRSAKVHQIYNGVELTGFHPRNGDEARAILPQGLREGAGAVFIWVGRMEAVKDPLNALKAFALQTVPGARLVMLGSGSQLPTLKARCAEIGVAERVWFAGERNDVAPLLRAADIYVLSSLNEGISNTILEAMASGLPVIASAVGGNAELVLDGETGALYPVGDARALAARMAQYASNPALCRAHGAAARARAASTFDLDQMVKRYAELYEALLNSGTSASLITEH